MYVITFPSEQHVGYLNHILDQHAKSGMPKEELPIAAEVFLCVSNARLVPEDAVKLGAAQVAEVGPNGIALEIDPNQAPSG